MYLRALRLKRAMLQGLGLECESTWGGLMSGRVSNCASEGDIAKVLRACLPAGPGNYSLTDPQELCTEYKEVIIDLLYTTPRPNKPLLVAGLMAAMDHVDRPQAVMWSERILVAIGYCRAKAQSMTSGKKLLSQCPAVKCIVEVIQKVSQKTTGQELVQRGQKLMQHQTPEAKPKADKSGDLDSQNSKATVDTQSSKGQVAHQSLFSLMFCLLELVVFMLSGFVFQDQAGSFRCHGIVA
jgi:hypothetical protein